MRIRDPGWKISDPGSGMENFGSGIRDGKKSDPGSGINIPDPQTWKIEKLCEFVRYEKHKKKFS
jgi:hypothetical protein